MKTNAEKEEHLLKLANACFRNLEIDSDYGTGLTMDCRRPFGNSGHGALRDTLDEVDALDDNDPDYDYARELWSSLPKFLKRCKVVLKEQP